MHERGNGHICRTQMPDAQPWYTVARPPLSSARPFPARSRAPRRHWLLEGSRATSTHPLLRIKLSWRMAESYCQVCQMCVPPEGMQDHKRGGPHQKKVRGKTKGSTAIRPVQPEHPPPSALRGAVPLLVLPPFQTVDSRLRVACGLRGLQRPGPRWPATTLSRQAVLRQRPTLRVQLEDHLPRRPVVETAPAMRPPLAAVTAVVAVCSVWLWLCWL